MVDHYQNGTNVGLGMVERETAEERDSRLYHELLYAVASKFPGETRHQTALRYIRQAETRESHGPERAADTSTSPQEGA